MYGDRRLARNFLIVLLVGAVPLSAQSYNGGAAAADQGVSSLTFSLTVNSGTNRVLACAASALNDGFGSAGAPTSLVFNGSETLTVFGTNADHGGFQKTYLFKRVNPTVTTANVVLTWDSTQSGLVAGCIVINGIDQSTTNRTEATHNGDTTTQPDIAPTSVVNDWVVDAISAWCHDLSGPDAGQTQRVTGGYGDCGGGIPVFGISMSTETAAGTTTPMGWTKTNGNSHTYIGAAFIPTTVAAATHPNVRRRRSN